jgi:hypothetical protein
MSKINWDGERTRGKPKTDLKSENERLETDRAAKYLLAAESAKIPALKCGSGRKRRRPG